MSDAAATAQPHTVEDAPRGGLLRSSAAVAGGTLLSRITGLVRVGALAFALGQAALSDAYNIANTSPNIVYELLLGGILSATLVPVLVEARERRRDTGDDGTVSALLSVGLVALIAITALAMAAAPLINNVLSRELGPEDALQRELQLDLLYLFLPQILFYGITSLLTAILNSRGRFVAAAYAPVLNNLIVSTMFLWFGLAVADRTLAGVADHDGLVLVLGLGTTAGVIAMTVVLLVPLARLGLNLEWRFEPRHPAVTRIARMSGWTVGYVVANQVALTVIATLALGLGKGDYTAYTMAFIFFQLPHGLFAVSIMTTAMPGLSAAAARGDDDAFRRSFQHGMRLILLFVAPAAAGLIVVGRPLVEVLLERGAFDAEATARTATVLVGFALGLPGFSVYLFAIRAFYARRDTRTPFLLNAFENALNVAFAVALLAVVRDITMLSIAFGLAYLVAAVAAVVVLNRRVTSTMDGATVLAVARFLAAAAVMFAVLWGAERLVTAPAAVELLVLVPLGAAVYLGLLRLLRVPEMREATAILRRRLPGGRN